MFKVTINVDPKKDILDPQGKTVQHALLNLGFLHTEQVRIGKHIVIQLQVDSKEEAHAMGVKMCQDLLANPLTEEYSVEVEPC
ncbi:MAG: phosphoribosylformylglycinamidine synthase subunit PurS [Caldisericia bacterium]|nr:phosphoribosylformylglycinamidine synthase subunit PurS [Caldisericia bacterium]MDD4614375.1 phosphoribosylformylglycinamidine synthase subunit PurS [Caldisericia bacterium]